MNLTISEDLAPYSNIQAHITDVAQRAAMVGFKVATAAAIAVVRTQSDKEIDDLNKQAHAPINDYDIALAAFQASAGRISFLKQLIADLEAATFDAECIAEIKYKN